MNLFSQINLFRRIKIYVASCAYILLIGVTCLTGVLYYLSQNLPSLDKLITPQYDLPTKIYDRNSNLITEFYIKQRELVSIEDVPDVLVKALVAIEDNRFYQHHGIDLYRIFNVLIIDVLRGEFVQGASTLTQQTAKMFLLTPEKRVIRKIREILLSLKMEKRLSKNRILELYLNKAYFGHGCYGIEAAALGYFNKHVTELNLAESALLVGLPQAPSKLAPTASIDRATRKRNLVLKKMAELGYISDMQRKQTSILPVKLRLRKQHDDDNETSYFAEYIRQYVHDKYGQNLLYRGGLKVYTTMDLKMQIYADSALRRGILEHDKRQGYRGPKSNLLKDIINEMGWDNDKYLVHQENHPTKEILKEKIDQVTLKNHYVIGSSVLGVVEQVAQKKAKINLGNDIQGRLLLKSADWARPVDYHHELTWKTKLNNLNDVLKTGDVIELKIVDYDEEMREFELNLVQKPLANGAIFVMDPNSGHVLAMSGGYDFRLSEFNRAIQSKRQAGSTFKPIVYSLALDSSFTPASLLDDTPFVDGVDGTYKPNNYLNNYQGKLSLREALVHSKNIPTIRLAKELGTKAIIRRARKMGITAELPDDDLTIALGSASLSLAELVKTYAIFANGGNLVHPTFILKVIDIQGHVLERSEDPIKIPVISSETAFLMTDILVDVVQKGSGWRAKALGRPNAGKTGTTDNYVDAWYVGYIPQLITGVHVGFDDNQRRLGENETGSRAAAPIWLDFMKHATAQLPVLPFDEPEGLIMVRINPDSGLLDCESLENARFEYFKVGTEPTHCHEYAGYQRTDFQADDTLIHHPGEKEAEEAL